MTNTNFTAPGLVVVTGASMGLGAQLARYAAKDLNCAVLAGGRTPPESVADYLREGGSRYERLDVTDHDSIKAFACRAETLAGRVSGPIYLFLNAGIVAKDKEQKGKPGKGGEDAVRKMMAVNIQGAHDTAMAFKDLMERVPGSRLVVSGSITRNGPIVDETMYAASKDWIHRFAKSRDGIICEFGGITSNMTVDLPMAVVATLAQKAPQDRSLISGIERFSGLEDSAFDNRTLLRLMLGDAFDDILANVELKNAFERKFALGMMTLLRSPIPSVIESALSFCEEADYQMPAEAAAHRTWEHIQAGRDYIPLYSLRSELGSGPIQRIMPLLRAKPEDAQKAVGKVVTEFQPKPFA